MITLTFHDNVNTSRKRQHFTIALALHDNVNVSR